jgi:hypothetical protein
VKFLSSVAGLLRCFPEVAQQGGEDQVLTVLAIMGIRSTSRCKLPGQYVGIKSKPTKYQPLKAIRSMSLSETSDHAP